MKMIAISLAVQGTLQTCDICNYMRIVAITFVVFRSLMSDELVLILVIGLQSQVDNLQDIRLIWILVANKDS